MKTHLKIYVSLFFIPLATNQIIAQDATKSIRIRWKVGINSFDGKCNSKWASGINKPVGKIIDVDILSLAVIGNKR